MAPAPGGALALVWTTLRERYDGLLVPSLPGAALSMAVSRLTGTVFVTGYIVSAPVSLYDYTTIAYHG